LGFFEFTGKALRCEQGHSFDLAKQGYVNLLHAGVTASTADTAEMVSARARFQSSGHYGRLAQEIAKRVRPLNPGLILDAGAGTGYYLASVLDEHPAGVGLALDVSALALRRAAKAHPSIGAAVWNLWKPWPVKSGCAQVIINVFAPRNATEFHRALDPQGTLIVVSPQAEHLREIRSMIDMIKVDDHKEERLNSTLGAHFDLVDHSECVYHLSLSAADIRDVVRMGPSAHHLHGELDQLEDSISRYQVTASFRISTYRPRKLTL
jgi:23S rRNA (guanine745-N1)-methyltransferase